jgi:hypothetical protein
MRKMDPEMYFRQVVRERLHCFMTAGDPIFA